MTRRLVTMIALGAAALASGSPAAASGAPTPDDPTATEQMRELRRLTARYHDVAVAEADGFTASEVCAESPDGTMGIHYVNLDRVDDTIVFEEPEMLVYLPEEDGLRLVAVEYMQVDADQDLATYDDRPELFGQPFDGPMEGHEPGQPVHYDLHVWAWDYNPSGVLAAWNPAISCPQPD